MKIVNFKQSTTNQEDNIKILEDALAEAKNGTLVDVALAKVVKTPDGWQMQAQYNGQEAFGNLLGSVQLMNHHMLDGYQDLSLDDEN